jgi:hypothetical protein
MSAELLAVETGNYRTLLSNISRWSVTIQNSEAVRKTSVRRPKFSSVPFTTVPQRLAQWLRLR